MKLDGVSHCRDRASHLGEAADARVTELPVSARGLAERPLPAPLPVCATAVRDLGLVLCVLAGAIVVGLQIAFPAVGLHVLHPVLHIQISTFAALVALLAALLAAVRFARTLMSRDLLVAAALGVLGTCRLIVVVPGTAGGYPGAYATWMPALGYLLGGALLAASAFAPARPVRNPAQIARRALLVYVAWLGGTSVLVLSLDHRLTRLSGLPPLAVGVGYQLLSGGLATLLIKGIGTALFSLAALGFLAHRRRATDWFEVPLVWGAMLLAFWSLSYLLMPGLYGGWFLTSDLFMLLAFLTLTAGATSEVRMSRRDAAQLAVMKERERLARDLHDGVAQELVYVLARARRLVRPGRDHSIADLDQGIADLVDAAQRALDESRSAISAFRAAPEEPLIGALERLTCELGRRLDLNVELRVPDSVEVSPEQREVIVRIVAEALSNAARHGGATAASVELIADDELQVRVCDDGRGFDLARGHTRLGAYGLLSMRERASLAGGRLAVRSAPGSPTEVEVVLP